MKTKDKLKGTISKIDSYPILKIAEKVLFEDGKKYIEKSLVPIPIAGTLLDLFKNEYMKWKTEGKLINDVEKTKEGRKAFSEILRYLKSDIPDEDVFEVLKAVAYRVFSEELPRDFDPVVYIEKFRTLDWKEIELMIHSYKYGEKWQKQERQDKLTYYDWGAEMRREVSFRKHPEIIDMTVEELSKKILMHRTADQSKETGRLTGLGYGMVDYLINSSRFKSSYLNKNYDKLYETQKRIS